jgi:two-component system LytT family response regulator
MNIRAIMVDDEELARKRLRKLLKSFETEIELVDDARTGQEAIQKIESLGPDLIFLDIQMPGMDGFEVIRRLRSKPFVIFVTAYDEYALKAFEEHSVDYLLKPVGPKRLEGTMEKLRRVFNTPKRPFDENLKGLLAQIARRPLKRIQVKTGDKFFFVNIGDIVYFEAKDKYCFLHTGDQEFIIDETLGELEEKLNSSDFVRIHRSAIVNMNFIREMVRWFGGKIKVRLNDKAGTELVASRANASRLRKAE